jgi:hypothetical protein
LPIAHAKVPEMRFSLAPDAQAGPFGQGVHHGDDDARAVLPDTLPGSLLKFLELTTSAIWAAQPPSLS